MKRTKPNKNEIMVLYNTVYIVKNNGVLGKNAFKYGISKVFELVKMSKGE